MKRAVRIGIDVGGTFTHAVAVDNVSCEVLSHKVTPTSHSSEQGVAAGILESFRLLQDDLGQDAEVVFLAHSTTQATNALLEGDVAKVGIVGLGQGLEGMKAKSDLQVGDIELSPGKYLRSTLQFVEVGSGEVAAAIEALKQEGCQALVAAQGFSVDDPSGEKEVMQKAAEAGLPSCGTHEMSGLYGLRVRARTAVLNASILPKMIETAEMTHQALQQRAVQAPLMIMRSDGGVMSLNEVRRRPVMTLLSGPAAGVAAALMFLKASDALFLEVGGTSTDICLVKDGKAAVKSASVGGHPTYLKTLDSRTLGIAGGSMIGKDQEKLQVGPRSAHLAGFPYCSFAAPERLEGELKVVEVHPLAGDPAYFVIENEKGERTSPTTTCAANLLGYIKTGDYSAGNLEGVKRAFEALASHLGKPSGEEVAKEVLSAAADKVLPTIKSLIKEYGVGDRTVKLLGGGGGAGAIVPIVAEKLGFPFEIANRAEVISAIGAALAMVRETVERTIVNPSQQDLKSIRAEAESAVIAMGADPETVEVTVAVDAQKNVVTATATGSVAFSEGETGPVEEVSPEERLKTLKETAPREDDFRPLGDTSQYYLFESNREEKYLFFFTRKRETLWVTDRKGNVKLQVPGGTAETASIGQLDTALQATLNKHTSYGDAGALIPALHVVAGRKMTDLTSLTTPEQVLTLARQELGGLDPETPAYFLVHPAKS
ncbi:MAG: hydantoinase/oxoprolinase family protein [Vulcanimicrobiota bacterium]